MTATQRLTGPKRELWLAWYVAVAFYGLYTVVFFVLSRTQPPGRPHLDPQQAVAWFADRAWGLPVGFGVVFLLGGFSAVALALIAYSIRRMSVSPVFAYAYLVLYAIAAIPGFLFICIAMTVGELRPDRDPGATQWLYDLGFLSFVGTMGVFLVGSLVWMVAILLDRNGVFPRWFGYLNLVNGLTEVVIAPSWIFQRGVLAYNGAIGFWVNVPVFGLYTAVFIYLLRDFIERDDLATGRLEAPPLELWTDPAAPDEGRFPGNPGMWVFVLIESLVFTSYSCIYLYARTQDQARFLEEQSALTMWLGVLDTIVLLTSSWSVARCAMHARAGSWGQARRAAWLTVWLGAAFAAMKVAEWVHLIGDGHTFTSSEFMQHFFFLTSIHAIHLVIGFVALGILLRQLSAGGARSVATVETCSTYWHTVDLFWIVIFALLYVVR